MGTTCAGCPSALILALGLSVCAPSIAGEKVWAAELKAGETAYRAGQYRAAAERYEAALRESESVSDQALIVTLNNLAEVYQAQGRFVDAEPLYRRTLKIAETTLRSDHPGLVFPLNSLAKLYAIEGRYADAEAMYRRVLSIREKALGLDNPILGDALSNLAMVYEAQGRYAEAEPLVRRVVAISDPKVGESLRTFGGLFRSQARFPEAERVLRRSLEIFEKSRGPEHPEVGIALNNVGWLYLAQRRFREAEPLFRRALEIYEKALAPDHIEAARSLGNLAIVAEALGRYSEAEALYRRALSIRESTLGREHPQVGDHLNNIAGLYQDLGRYTEAETLHRRALVIRETAMGMEHWVVGDSLYGLGSLYRKQKRLAEAELFYTRAFEIQEKALGPEHPRTLGSMYALADLKARLGNPGEALQLARRASTSSARRFMSESGGSHAGAMAERRSNSWGFEIHVSLLAALAARNPEMRPEDAVESFRIAQFARASDTADQLTKMAARFAAGNETLAALARARQDALAKHDYLATALVQSAGRPGNQALVAKLRTEQAETVSAIAEIGVRLDREFPQYWELLNPKPLEVSGAQGLLGADEAMVLFLVAGDESYLWVVRRGDVGFFKLAIKRDELVDLVTKIRTQLDLGVEDAEAMLGRSFDVAAAHALYRQILGPAEALLAGAKHLILVPDGALSSLPPGVLVTENPSKPIQTMADHAQVAWLVKKYAITVLPAVTSLRALRQFAKVPASREPFGGFGDPVLDGNGEGTRRMNVAALNSRGAVADVNEVRKLPRLPETADELRAIAAQLKAPATSIRVGPAATERAVKEADLTKYRNLAFATHGLMAGDFKGLAEPALVLTPPAEGSEIDDGLLTAGEISQLKLDADWVVLSACNTAAPDGTPGAEGLSGLAQAFFYAGARSLLVSHWAVSSEAAMALTTRMFEESSKGASKAEALRRSMFALMARKDKEYFAHPALWAPFVVVGEGNAEWAVSR